MASLFILSMVSLLLSTSNAAPRSHKGIVIPEECRGQGFCSIKPKGYDELVEKFKDLLPPYIENFDSRSSYDIAPHSVDDDNCPSFNSWESVYTYEDSNKTDIDIIVQTKLFPQNFLRVQCMQRGGGGNEDVKIGEGGQCFTKIGVLSNEFACHQYNAMRSLLVYDPTSDTLITKSYSIPVCCSCRVKNL